MTLLDRTLAEPSFVDRDAEAITRDLVRMYEELTGLTLYPAQAERLMVNVVAYRDKLMREAIQDAAKLNLVRYSRGVILDLLGENIGVARLDPAPAECTMRFVFDPVPVVGTLLPAGTLVSTSSSGVPLVFSTAVDVLVPAGAAEVSARAVCTTLGALGNGFVAGQIARLYSGQPPGLQVSAVANTTTSSAGADAEDDDHLRRRIVLAPEQFSNCGSREAYTFFALGANAGITDVAITSPEPGLVHIHPLMSDGLPSLAVLAQVLAACNGETRRPLCDTVVAVAPVVRPLALTIQLTLYTGADATTAQAAAQKAATAYVQRIQARMGVDVVPSQIKSALDVYGVYRVNVVLPADVMVLAPNEWPQVTALTVTVVGDAEG
ncbi:baseplate assembly protein [Hydrogenophaga sp. A37]|uniref:baseplate assembly protein n=1 Tax=Hydrogenophaga sp. A37 TaxID=1945864 RepID=UPI000987C0BA|nr:baseplate J/gp47 family protein [Hydrogenophaga sp. A37]OOG79164.1 phage tail protein [Hydrogenophaga sp. A37]